MAVRETSSIAAGVISQHERLVLCRFVVIEVPRSPRSRTLPSLALHWRRRVRWMTILARLGCLQPNSDVRQEPTATTDCLSLLR